MSQVQRMNEFHELVKIGTFTYQSVHVRSSSSAIFLFGGKKLLFSSILFHHARTLIKENCFTIFVYEVITLRRYRKLYSGV